MNNGIVIIAHAPLASALRQCVAHVFPERVGGVVAVDVLPDAPVALSVAQARQAIEVLGRAPLLLLTDVPGVKNDQGDVVTELSTGQIRKMTREGTIAGGMIPKTETALKAIEGGVRAVVILDGRAPNACLLELFTEHGAGSLIRAE